MNLAELPGAKLAALYLARASKQRLADVARAHGWRGDDARTSKGELAAYLAQKADQEQRAAILDGLSIPHADAIALATSTSTDDAREMTARFPGKCAKCSGAIQRGERIAYVKAERKAYHIACHDAAEHGNAEMRDHEGEQEEAPKAAPNAQAQIAAAIAGALGNLKIGVDDEQVRAIVRAELGDTAERVAAAIREALKDEVREVRVIVNDAAAVNVGKQHKQFPLLLQAVGAGCSVWLAGPAGSGKTSAAEAVARSLGVPFWFDGALDTEYKLLGYKDANGNTVRTNFREAFEHGGVYLADECDGWLAPAALALNAALANGVCSFPDGIVKRHAKFVCIAAGNTWGLGATAEYIGRNKQDAAFLDRFVRINWDYDEVFERELTLAINPEAGEWISQIQTWRAKARAKGLKVVISPRASLHGAKLLLAGMKRAEVEALTVRNGLTDDQFRNLNG
jgi:hypothetical protein